MAFSKDPMEFVGAGLSVIGGLAGIFGGDQRKKALRQAAEESARFEDLKFDQRHDDTMETRRALTETQNSSYAANGIDFRHGSPLAVQTDSLAELTEGLERARLERDFRVAETFARAQAGMSSETGRQVATGINTGANVLSILGRR